MARLERVFAGTKWQLFAAVYECVVERGIIDLDVDVAGASLSYSTNRNQRISLWSADQHVTIWVGQIDDTSCVVCVETEARSRWGSEASDLGEGTRLAKRILDRVQDKWASPRRSFGGPGWYPDPASRGRLRWWDGVIWTSWVWRGDALRLDPPRAAGWGVERTFDSDVLAVRIRRYVRPPFPPPIFTPPAMLGKQRYRRVVARNAAVGVGSIVVLAVLIWILVKSSP